MARIAVDEGLTNVREFLRREGFEVVLPENATDVAAVVVSGMQENMLGREDVMIDAPVVDARGKTPAEILGALRDALGNRRPGDQPPAI